MVKFSFDKLRRLRHFDLRPHPSTGPDGKRPVLRGVARGRGGGGFHRQVAPAGSGTDNSSTRRFHYLEHGAEFGHDCVVWGRMQRGKGGGGGGRHDG